MCCSLMPGIFDDRVSKINKRKAEDWSTESSQLFDCLLQERFLIWSLFSIRVDELTSNM